MILAFPTPALAQGPWPPQRLAETAAEPASPSAPTEAEAKPAGANGLPSSLVDAAMRNHVPPSLLHGIVMVESGYNCRARNGPWQGVGQITRQAAKSVGVFGNLFDCGNGMEAAARYARLALDRAGGDWSGAATLYNQGVNAAPRRSAYSARVMRFALAHERIGPGGQSD
jgi:soluble lytic murein transglycosylase-like protein